MMNQMTDYQNTLRLEILISDTLQRCNEVILQRNSELKSFHNNDSSDCMSDSSRSIVSLWKQDYSLPIYIDIYLSSDQVDGEVLLIERWRIVFLKNEDIYVSSSISKKLSTFLRSLQCFTRLLPGFLLLNYSTSLPSLYYDIYNKSTQKNHHDNFSVDTSTYQLPIVTTSKGTLSVSVKYTQASTIQSFLQLPSKTGLWSLAKLPKHSSSSYSSSSSSQSSKKANHPPQLVMSSPTKPIPISQNLTDYRRDRSESLGSIASGGYSPVADKGKYISKTSPSGRSPFSTPPKQGSLSTNFKHHVRRDSYSPMPPFTIQEPFLNTIKTTSGIALSGSFDEPSHIISPLKHRANLISTSPQTNIWTLQSVSEANIRKAHFDTIEDSKLQILQQLQEFQSKIKFPASPFDINTDSRVNDLEPKSNDLIFEKDKKDILFDVEDFYDNSLNDENMPFAEMNSNVNCVAMSPDTHPVNQLSIEIAPLVSFNDSIEYINGQALHAAITSKLNEYKKLYDSLK